MSALGLRYPKKPSELADDLESFVYVIVYMALRWHRHDKSSVIPDGETPVELSTVNSKNTRLAETVHSLFTESFPCADGYWGGGERKIQIIKSGDLPLTLDPLETPEGPVDTPLATLIKKLYALLYEHYYALDYSKLESYAVPQVKKVSIALPDPAAAAKQEPAVVVEPSYVDPEDAEHGGGDDDSDDTHSDESEDEQPRPASSSRRRVRVVSPKPSNRRKQLARTAAATPPAERSKTEKFAPKPPHPSVQQSLRRVLDSHEEIVDIFRATFKYEDGRQKDLSKARKDKHFDQFAGLQAMIGAPPKKFTTKRSRGLCEEDDEFYYADSDGPSARKKPTVARLDFGQDVVFKY